MFHNQSLQSDSFHISLDHEMSLIFQIFLIQLLEAHIHMLSSVVNQFQLLLRHLVDCCQSLSLPHNWLSASFRNPHNQALLTPLPHNQLLRSPRACESHSQSLPIPLPQNQLLLSPGACERHCQEPSPLPHNQLLLSLTACDPHNQLSPRACDNHNQASFFWPHCHTRPSRCPSFRSSHNQSPAITRSLDSIRIAEVPTDQRHIRAASCQRSGWPCLEQNAFWWTDLPWAFGGVWQKQVWSLRACWPNPILQSQFWSSPRASCCLWQRHLFSTSKAVHLQKQASWLEESDPCMPCLTLHKQCCSPDAWPDPGRQLHFRCSADRLRVPVLWESLNNFTFTTISVSFLAPQSEWSYVERIASSTNLDGTKLWGNGR